MQWIKNNLVLVIGAVVSLALIGGAGFYFYSRIAAEKEAETQLAQVRATLVDYQGKIPTPTKDNVEAALQQQKLLVDFKTNAARFFPVLNTNITMRNDQFGAYLLESLFELQRDAQRASVQLPTNFGFSFSAQRTLLQFDGPKIPLLVMQVNDVKSICKILYQARIYEILGVRRSMASAQDNSAQPSQPQDYLSKRPVTTNDVVKAVVFPYEASFKCSTAELAAAMDGLARSSNGFVVKAVKSEPGDTGQEGEGADVVAATTPSGGYIRGMPAAMAARYGLGMRRPMPQMAQPTAPAGGPAQPMKKGPGVVLKEKPLKITLLVDAVRLSPTQ